MKKNIDDKLLAAIVRSGKKGLLFGELKKVARGKNITLDMVRNSIQRLCANGKTVYLKNRYYTPKALGIYPAKIVRNNRTFCFAQRLSDDAQIFIPGKHSQGAMQDDFVLVKPQKQLGESEEGVVVSITQYGPSTFTGILQKQGKRYFVMPDSLSKDLIPVTIPEGMVAAIGDKVIAKAISRGNRHSEHRCELVSSHGSAETASACAAAILEANGISTEFPSEVQDNAARIAQKGISDVERRHRLDLTDLPIFTIDSAESKDLDDAISIEKGEHCYYVGVHIADVSHYVKYRSPLDLEAFERGTSIYYANKVVPMLPKELSNGICSLNPDEERLAFSALLNVGFDGKLTNFTFKKTIIRSRIKGIYKEINSILDDTATEEIKQKYEIVKPEIQLMYELYQILLKNKIKRGAPQIETTESKILIDDREQIVDIQPRTQGISEGIIEEFMLLANEAAATLARKQDIPFVYRVHERPSPEKVSSLKQILDRLGLPSNKVEPKMKPGVMSKILEKSRDTELFPIVNTQVLRTMSKAKYSEFPIGHYGLALENYSHFTSPIRRYPDLTIHRILSDLLCYYDSMDAIQKRYQKFVVQAARHSSETEMLAMQIERDCEDCYKAEYMTHHIGEIFEGIIISVLGRGFYVELPNTVEGYIKIESLDGPYEYDGFIRLNNSVTGKSYQVGQHVMVQCVAADVNAGNIDFELVEPEK